MKLLSNAAALATVLLCIGCLAHANRHGNQLLPNESVEAARQDPAREAIP